jgi:hypothetical protein
MGQAKFFEMPNAFEHAQWRDFGRHLMRHEQDLEEKQDSLPWKIGDWLVEGVEGGLKSRVLKRDALGITQGKYSWGTLGNFMTVSSSIEPSRRRENLDYSMHQLVARFSVENQERLLDMATSGNPKVTTRHGNPVPYTFRPFKDLIMGMQERGELPMTTRKPIEARFVVVNIKIPVAEHSFLKTLALAKQFHKKKPANYDDGSGIYGGRPGTHLPDVGSVIWWMASQYYKEHKTELDSLPKQPKS